MKLSIALCTYNGERFLPDQLESIRRQTRQPDELVACDDCSTDRTLEILRAFAESVPFPVHIHRNERNLRSTKNFEKAIGLCTGDIIALSDQDDVWKPQKLQRLESALLEHPEAGYVFSDADLADEHLQPLGRRLWDSVGFKGEIKERFIQREQLHCFLRQHIVTGATMAFRSEVGKIATPFPTSGNWIHDGWIALVASSAGLWGIPVDDPLISYRQHAGQQIGAPQLSARKEKEKKRTLLQMYRDLKKDEELLFRDWERRHLKYLLALPSLERVEEKTPELEKSLGYLKRLKTHFVNRREILTSGGINRYRLILKEALSGRYAEFSDSWRSIFRDIFL